MNAHTPTPWKFIPHDHNPESQWLGNIQGSYGLDKDGIENIRTISCQTKYEIAPGEARANAEFIILAVNSHADLVAALEAARKEMMELNEPCDHSVGVCWCEYHRTLETMDAALAKARGTGEGNQGDKT